MAAIIAIASTLATASPTMLGSFARGTALFLAVLALWVIQLVPLPPSLWLSMPGHAILAQSAVIANEPQPWRPLSLSPDLTIEAMLALMVPVAAIILTLRAPQRWLEQAPLALMILTVLSVALAAGQAAGEPDSALRWYPVSDIDVAPGLLANRNHQGLLVSLGIPSAFIWAMAEKPGRLPLGPRLLIAFAVTALCVIGALITQSRGAMLFVVLGTLLSAAAIRHDIVRQIGARLALVAVSIGTVVIAGIASLALPYQRLTEVVATDDRAYIWADTIKMLWAYFPFGSGGGTFVDTYPRFQGIARLRPEYVNHAHNELLEFISENGLIGMMLIGAGAWMLISRMAQIAREKQSSPLLGSGRLAAILIMLSIVASLVDYPLRAPLMTSLFACAVVILRRARSESHVGAA
ncbi:MAG: O-antigen ligase family protein [Sphingomonas sp.]|nr:O-antigen ligase family protein [Sphingomonas sp.]